MTISADYLRTLAEARPNERHERNITEARCKALRDAAERIADLERECREKDDEISQSDHVHELLREKIEKLEAQLTTQHFSCPVCDYPDLAESPTQLTYEICPQCGVEFGYEDPESYPAIRQRWLAAGRPFWRDNPKWDIEVTEGEKE